MSTLISTTGLLSSSNGTTTNNSPLNKTPETKQNYFSAVQHTSIEEEEDNSWKAPGSSSRRASVLPLYNSNIQTPNKKHFGGMMDNNSDLFLRSDYTNLRRQSLTSNSLLSKSTLKTPLFATALTSAKQGSTTAFVNNKLINSPMSLLNKGSIPIIDNNNNSRSKSISLVSSPFYNSNTSKLFIQPSNKTPSTNNADYDNYLINRLEKIKIDDDQFNMHKNTATIGNRRHSLASTLLFNNIGTSASERSLSNKPISPRTYAVEFKDGRRDEFLALSTTHLELNDYVIVEADRGKDLGKVSDIITSTDNLTNHENNEMRKMIHRKATDEEIESMKNKIEEEQTAVNHCQLLIKEYDLNMQVISAEYQFDRKKLTFYFIAEKRIDFRVLVKELFRFYKTRIWMCAVNHRNNTIHVINE